MKNINIFYLKFFFFFFLVVKISTYLNRRVFVMWVYTVCQCPFHWTLGINALTGIDTLSSEKTCLPPPVSLGMLLLNSLSQRIANSCY